MTTTSILVLVLAITVIGCDVQKDPAGTVFRSHGRGCIRADYVNPTTHVWFCDFGDAGMTTWEEP